MNFREISTGLIIGLLIGVGAGYILPQQQIGVLKNDVEILKALAAAKESRVIQLQSEMTIQSNQITEINQDIDKLESDYEEIQSEHQELLVNHEELTSEYGELQSEYIDYLGYYQRMWDNYDDLIQAYNNLSDVSPVGQVVSTEIPGIVNGDFEAGFEGWVKQGKGSLLSGVRYLHQYQSGTFLTQTITVESKKQGLSFWVKPAPVGADINFEIIIGNYLLFTELYEGQNTDFEWAQVVIPFKALFEMRELYDLQTAGKYEIRFNIPAGDDNGAHIMLDNVSLVEIEYHPEEPASNQTTLAAPNIDGYIEVGEWADFQESTLEYWVTYNYSIRCDSVAWDTNDKSMSSSILLDDTHLYACFVIPDDYLSEEFQIRSVHLFINGYETTVRWESQNE
ncbi:hypothetical protein KA005_57785 [bacterium]|nr:hypothetical protein [bacterium]